MISHDLIITTYNSYNYLDNIYLIIKENISLYTNIICVDDFSDENFYISLKEKLSEFTNLKLYRNNKNLGPSGARNFGINLSSSEYITFHDPDDIILKNRFFYLKKIIKEIRPNILFHGFSLSNKSCKFQISNHVEIHNGFLYLFKSLYVTPAFTCKREILNDVGGYDINIRYAEDLDLYIRLRRKFNFYFLRDEFVIVSNRLEKKGSIHLSGNYLFMRKSINKILIRNILRLKTSSLIFFLALLANLIKTLREIIFLRT